MFILYVQINFITCQWSHESHANSNYWQLDFNSSFKLATKKISKLCITSPWRGELTSEQWFPSERASNPDSKVHGANTGPTRVLSAPGGPHVSPTNPAIRESKKFVMEEKVSWNHHGHLIACDGVIMTSFCCHTALVHGWFKWISVLLFYSFWHCVFKSRCVSDVYVSCSLL